MDNTYKRRKTCSILEEVGISLALLVILDAVYVETRCAHRHLMGRRCEFSVQWYDSGPHFAEVAAYLGRQFGGLLQKT